MKREIADRCKDQRDPPWKQRRKIDQSLKTALSTARHGAALSSVRYERILRPSLDMTCVVAHDFGAQVVPVGRLGRGVAEEMTGDVDWFDVGWESFKEERWDADSFPPLNDMEAQRAWLGGFGAAWVEAADEAGSVDEALMRALEGRAALLRQLRSHRGGWGSRAVQ